MGLASATAARTRTPRAACRRGVAARTVLALAGCLALVGCGAGREASRGDEGWARLLENRAWIEEGAAAPGTTRAWMSGGQLMTASCWEEPRFAPWRWTGDTTFEWREGERAVRAEVAMVGPDELVLMLGTGVVAETRRYQSAEVVGDPC